MGNLVDEILTRLRAIVGISYATVWNEQFRYLEEGKDWAFPMPCAFVEIVADELQDIGGKYQGSDIGVIIHLGQNVLNSDQISENLSIFDLRDKLIVNFSTFKPTTAGLFVKVSESQDYDHTNVYHYKVGYKLHWIDDTAVVKEDFTIPPTALATTITITG